MRKRPGTVRDIRTGRAIGHTRSLTETFTKQVIKLITEDEDFYIVHGRCRWAEIRWTIDEMKKLNVKVIYDRQMPTDTMWIFEGDPAELGFAS